MVYFCTETTKTPKSSGGEEKERDLRDVFAERFK